MSLCMDIQLSPIAFLELHFIFSTMFAPYEIKLRVVLVNLFFKATTITTAQYSRIYVPYKGCGRVRLIL